jgi:hypothetical protein
MKKQPTLILVSVLIIILLWSIFYLNKTELQWIKKYPFQWYDRGINDILNIDFWKNIKILDKYNRISFSKLPTNIHNNYIHNKVPIGYNELKNEIWEKWFNKNLTNWNILIVSPFNSPPEYITTEDQLKFYWDNKETYSTGNIISYNIYTEIKVKSGNENILNFYPINRNVWWGTSQSIDILNPNIILYDSILLPNDFKVTINKGFYIPELKYKKVYNHHSDKSKYSLIPYYELKISLSKGIHEIYYQYYKYEKNRDIITIEWK